MQRNPLFSALTLPFTVTALAASVWAASPESSRRTFATPREAAQALLAAAETGDVSALSAIFGPDADEILNSGDAVQDKNDVARFVKRAKQSMKERVDSANANYASLLIGPDNFPFPIPLVRTLAAGISIHRVARPRFWRGGSGPTNWMRSRRVRPT